MAEYASKGVSGTALGLGVAGTVALANQLFNGEGLGFFNGNRAMYNAHTGMAAGAELQYVSKLQADIARLEAEKYSDKDSKEVYAQTLRDNKTLRDEMFAYIEPIAKEVADNRVKVAVLETKQECCCKEQDLKNQLLKSELHSEITSVANTASCGLQTLTTAVSCLQNTVNDIVKTVVNKDAICPEVMDRYNSWTPPTNTPTTTTSK